MEREHFPPVIYRGSVKNVRGEVSAPHLLFEFSDRYSVFDWGEMPDQLSGKGDSLAFMGQTFFELLGNSQEWQGLELPTYELQNNELQNNNALKSLLAEYQKNGVPHHASIKQGQYWGKNFLEVKNIKVLHPQKLQKTSQDSEEFDYKIYLEEKPVGALVPLEIIFRLGLAKGNSLSKRLGQNLDKWNAFGFLQIPEEGKKLKRPLIDFSTKLEPRDRYLSYKEAKQIAGLSEGEWEMLSAMATLIGLFLEKVHKKMGLELWDGKIEVAFVQEKTGTDRSFMLVDSVGIDELRLLYKDKSFSKEFLREHYKESSWYSALEKAKKDAELTGGDFKQICAEKYQETPEHLPAAVKKRAEFVYKSYANALALYANKSFPFSNEFQLKVYSERYLI